MKRLLEGLQKFKTAPGINITDVLYPSDRRAFTAECQDAIARQIFGLLNRGVFEILDERDLPADANIITHGPRG